MTQDIRYKIEGITPLRGEVSLSGAKNATLPCICAALLTKDEVVLHNVPEIADVFTLLEIFDFLGVKNHFENHTLRIKADTLECKEIPIALVKRLRASILLLGPLLARCGEVTMGYPGGDIIGKRPVDAHLDALVQLGAENRSDAETLRLFGVLRGGEIVLPEFSVTATENVLLAAAAATGNSTIHIAAAEPHVQDLCRLLIAMGTPIGGVGSHDLAVSGGRVLHDCEHVITTDYLEAGFFALAGMLTGGDLRIKGVRYDQLRSFFKALSRLGAQWDFEEGVDGEVLHVSGGSQLRGCKIQTNIFPGLPSDLHPAIGVAMTQANGVSRIHEFLYEGRFGYLYELEKMGANVEMLNAHEALIIGPTPLRGRTVASHDVRAGGAMVLAALCARGESLITDVQYIERGYEKLEQKLRILGASIERIGGDQVESTHGQDSKQRRNDDFVLKRGGVAAPVS